jgi:hypothetical protein
MGTFPAGRAHRCREQEALDVGISPSENDGTPPARLDTRIAHSARVRNYLLGGRDNFAADREAGDLLMQIYPDIAHVARLQRRFLARSVGYLAGRAGIRQFLDIGAGLPAAEYTHQIAQRAAPQSRIAYVDNDPLVLSHAGALPASPPGGLVGYVEADVRDTEEILDEAARTLDFGEPVALIMLGILGHVPDSAGPDGIVATLLGALAPGSYLVLSHGTDTSAELSQAVAVYNQHAASGYQLRRPEQIAGFFAGLTLVPPGIVTISRWRPGLTDASAPPRAVAALCGVGRKD